MLINPAWGLGLSVETLPLFWEAQQNCLEQVPNCAMVVIADITVDTTDIHPVNKRDVGRRLARAFSSETRVTVLPNQMRVASGN